MSFADDIEKRALSIRQAILAHPFLSGVGDGSLPLDKFRHYMTQDYAYLIEYSRVLALASARAPDLETMGWFAGLLDETLNTEMELHRSFCAEFGISRQQLEETPPAPTTVGYTSFLLKVAPQGGFAVLVAAVRLGRLDGMGERMAEVQVGPLAGFLLVGHQHGEAVSIGMLAAAHLAVSTGRCPAHVADRLARLLQSIGLPTRADDLPSTVDLVEAMAADKKVADGRIRFVLPDRIGHVDMVADVPRGSVAAAWDAIRK